MSLILSNPCNSPRRAVEVVNLAGGSQEKRERDPKTALFCISFLRKGEVLAYVGLPQILKDLKDHLFSQEDARPPPTPPVGVPRS